VTGTADGSERRLISAAKAGDANALEELLDQQQARVFRFGLKMCGDTDDAEEILQETLLAMARTIRGFRGESSLATWMFTIARSFCIKKRRRRKGSPDVIEPLRGDEADGRTSPEADAIRNETAEKLDRAIKALPRPYREVLLLCDVEGLTAREVATILGVRVEAVKSRLHRARLAIREALAPPSPASALPGCPDVLGLFSRRLEGQVTPRLCREMESHLATCGHCDALCTSLRQTLELCRSTPAPSVPAELQESIRAAVRRLRGS
jgi:RNA polymerase sigma-70 factor, ECF subfamily